MKRMMTLRLLCLMAVLTLGTVSSAHAGGNTPESVIHGLQTDWNNADMDAYLGAYRGDDQLRLVFGNTVVKGMDAVSKLFRANYHDEHTMGKFTVESLSVRHVSDDVAIATGTFQHVFPHETVDGGFSHVLHREESGKWVIQHEHTSRGQVTHPQ